MPKQNRVNPFGRLEAVSARGMFTGNRGCLVDDAGRLHPDRWRTKAWICCVLAWKDVRRPIMQPRTWTELFFLDEATALAAGHRPCAYCRREAYRRYLAACGLDRAKAIDERLHAERRAPRILASFAALPNGAMVSDGDRALLKWREACWLWSHSGYTPHKKWRGEQPLLTPPLSVLALQNGYALAVTPALATLRST